jgi:hypothetical protein
MIGFAMQFVKAISFEIVAGFTEFIFPGQFVSLRSAAMNGWQSSLRICEIR